MMKKKTESPLTPELITDMREHLKHLNDKRLTHDDWLHIGWALKGYPFELYDEFSKRADCYDIDEAYQVFNSECKTKKKYTVSTIFWMLKQDDPQYFRFIHTKNNPHKNDGNLEEEIQPEYIQFNDRFSIKQMLRYIEEDELKFKNLLPIALK